MKDLWSIVWTVGVVTLIFHKVNEANIRTSQVHYIVDSIRMDCLVC